MDFHQGVPFVRQPVVPEDSLPIVLDASVLVFGKSLHFLLAERNPSKTSKYNIFWQDEFLAIHGFVNDLVENRRGKPSPAILADHPLLRDSSSTKRKPVSPDASSPK